MCIPLTITSDVGVEVGGQQIAKWISGLDSVESVSLGPQISLVQSDYVTCHNVDNMIGQEKCVVVAGQWPRKFS